MNVGVSLRYLTLSQRDNYNLRLNKPFFRTWFLSVVFAALAFIPVSYFTVISYAVGAATALTLYFTRRTKLKPTKRVAFYCIFPSIYSFIPVLFCITEIDGYALISAQSATAIVSFLSVKFSELVFNRYFERKNKRFIMAAAEKIHKSGTKIIAITGSFGKTSCKNILYVLLKGYYNVAMTEENRNTPMGIALSINKLTGTEEYFICEFGARKKGDIEELSAYYPPDIGIITGVCGQHSGVFGTLQVIYNEKFLLAKNIKKEGFCAFGNNLYAKKMYKEYVGDKISVGACEDIYAENVCRLVGKTTFNLHIHEKCEAVSTCLCGKQALENLLLCVAVADKMRVPAEMIFLRISSVEQTPHRLEYSCAGGVHILDDSYNSNTIGVRYALEYLSICPSPRIVVAQGVVELGIRQREENIHIGEEIASVADHVILSGINKKAIRTGLKRKMYKGTIMNCRGLKKVKKSLKRVVCPGATVLFQNDLPDIY